MALDTRTRPQQPSMHYMPAEQMPPQFTDPWGSQGQLHDAAANLHSLAKPSIMRTSAGSSPFMTTLAPVSSLRHLTPPTQYTSAPSMMAHPTYTTSDMSMPVTSAPSPTTLASSYSPSYSSSYDVPRTLPTERRLSHPTMSTPLYLGADMLPKQRQASLTDMVYRPRQDPDFNSALDSARGMVVMSQTNPRNRNQYPSSHSASSSISSNHSFPYYSGSVDSSATDYSETSSGYPNERGIHQATLPRPNIYINGTGAPVPGQMMTTFSSKITSSTQKKHKCKVCDKRFTRPSSLQTHTYSHTGEKPFVCEHQGCGRRFSVVSNLRRHKKVHQGKSHAA